MPKPEILHIHVELGGRVYDGDLDAEARVDTDPVGLNKALAEQSGRFAWWATLEVLAKTLAEQLERQLATRHAELYSYLEATLTSTDGKGKRSRPTVEKIKSAVLADKVYQNLQERVAQANEQVGLLQVARQTMSMRRDMLMTVASNMRAEREAGIYDHLRETRTRLEQSGRVQPRNRS